MNHIEELLVVKRSGEVVNFDLDRISNAIKAAIDAGDEKYDANAISNIVESIHKEIDERFTEFYPNVENIQDIVEKHLLRSDMLSVARRYIIYRAERSAEREKQKENISRKAELGKLKVTKRDGTTVLFNPQKVRETIYRVCQKYPNTTSVDAIAKELSRNIFDGATTNDIEKALLLASTAFIERDPDYSKVSAGFFMQRLYKEAIGISINENTFLDEYRKTFKDGIKLGVENKYLGL